jgi:hypothetical protein
MYALFPYTHHTHSLSHHSSKENKTLNILYVFTQCEALSTSKYQPSFTSTSVSICRSYISKSYTHHTWASRLRTSQEKTSRYVCSFSLYTPYALSKPPFKQRKQNLKHIICLHSVSSSRQKQVPAFSYLYLCLNM